MFDYNLLLDRGYSTPRCILCSYVAVNGRSVLSDVRDTVIDLRVTYYMSDYRLHTCLVQNLIHRLIFPSPVLISKQRLA